MAQESHSVPQSATAQPGAAPSAVIPDHDLIRRIGSGSYGEVWLACNRLGTYRAVKIVFGKTFRHARPFEREFNGVQKFEPISRLHEGLVDVLQVGRNDAAGYFYCVMELADDVASGQKISPDTYLPRTLAHDITQHKRLPVADCRRIAAAVASALDFLHKHGLIHRDIKPSNIVFVNGAPKLADIGLVAEMSEAKSYVGTEGFIPPEGPGTVEADIYSLGKVLYEISTGKDRHDYPDLPTHLGEPAERDGLMALNAVVLKACQINPAQRYRSAAAMAAALREGRRSRRNIFQRIVRPGIAAAAIAVVSFLSFHQTKAPPATALADRPAGLVARWDAEGTAEDSVHHIKGIPRRGVTFVPGIHGRAFHFDGNYSGIALGNPPELQLQNLTIAAWIKRDDTTRITNPAAVSDDGVILGYGFGGYSLQLSGDGRLFFPGYDKALADVSLNRPLILDTNWHHVAVSKRGAAVTFFVDGVAYPNAVNFTVPFTFTRDVNIGGAGQGFESSFLGAIDDLEIYNRPLTPEEIRKLYHADPENALPKMPPGLVHWWRAEGNANDSAGADHGILMEGASFAPGKAGQAFRFDGVRSCVKIPYSPTLDVSNQFTIAFWMKADANNSLGGYQGLVSTDFYQIEIANGYTWGRMGVNLGASTDAGATPMPDTATSNGGGAVVSVNQWHHVVGTYDGTKLQLYIDGKPWEKPAEQSGKVSPMLTGSFLSIGSEDGRTFCPFCVGTRYFSGLIDEVAIYDRALSAEEVAAIFQAGTGSSPAF